MKKTIELLADIITSGFLFMSSHYLWIKMSPMVYFVGPIAVLFFLAVICTWGKEFSKL